MAGGAYHKTIRLITDHPENHQGPSKAGTTKIPPKKNPRKKIITRRTPPPKATAAYCSVGSPPLSAAQRGPVVPNTPARDSGQVATRRADKTLSGSDREGSMSLALTTSFALWTVFVRTANQT